MIFTRYEEGNSHHDENDENDENESGPEFMIPEDEKFFWDAIQYEQLDVLSYFFDQGFSPMVKIDNYEHQTVAQWACSECKDKVVKLFLSRGYDPNFGSPFDRINLLTQAIYNMDIELIHELLDLGATLQCRESDDIETIEENGHFLLERVDKSYYLPVIYDWLEKKGVGERLNKSL